SADAALAALLTGSGFTTRTDGKLVAIVKAGNGEAASPVSSYGVAEILVQGHRTINADVRRSEDGVRPTVVIGREEILESGATNVEEFLKSRIPMNQQRESSSQSLVNNINLQGSINLRGLGP